MSGVEIEFDPAVIQSRRQKPAFRIKIDDCVLLSATRIEKNTGTGKSPMAAKINLYFWREPPEVVTIALP